MPRSLVLGNGRLLVTFDEYLQMRDLYYPHVGMENHTAYKHFHRLGFFISGKFSWINDGSWQIAIDYAPDTLVGHCTALNENLQVKILFEDFVYTTSDILFRKLTITNLADAECDIHVFFCHDFHLYGDKMQDTAEYEPVFDGIMHYRGNRYFLVSGSWTSGQGMDEFSVGKSEYMGREGTFRDAEDGHLEGNTIEQGSVDSAIRFSAPFAGGETKVLFFWLIASQKYEDMREHTQRIGALGPQLILEHTRDFWSRWVNKENFEFKGVPPELIRLFKRSLLLIRTQTDDSGAIIAANDSDIMQFNKDTYTYMWPRDAALVAVALSETGYEAMVRDFLFFCRKILTKEGFMLHKYNPDGSVGSSWLPKMKNGEVQLPIQEDETALVLVAMQKYYECFRNLEVVQQLYNGLVLKIGRWLGSYVDKKTGLPLASYDLWEEQRGVFSYTASCVFAGLNAAGFLSAETGHERDAKKFFAQAKKIQKAISTHLYSEKEGRFLRKVIIKDGQISASDTSIDASMAFLWKMGVLPITDDRIQHSMEAIFTELTVPTAIGGLARYKGDAYHFDFSQYNSAEIPGNPWIITTLWGAEYQMLLASSREELERPLNTMLDIAKRANSAGILPEQSHPLNGAPISVAPLTWSHATFVSALMLFMKRWRELGKCQVTIRCD